MNDDMTPNETNDNPTEPIVEQDVLAGWDPNGDPYMRTQEDAPFPVDLLALAGGALAGTLLAVSVRKSSLIGATTLGTLVGAGIAIGARRMWRLEP